MNNNSFSLQAAISVWQRNLLGYSKTWMFNILTNFFEPVFYLVGMGLGVGFYIKEIAGVPYPIFITPGLVAIATMNGASFEATYNVYVRMNYNRTYDAVLATPVTESEIVFGEMLWATSRAWIYGMVFLLITAAFGYVPSWTSLGLLLAIIPTGYFFTMIGMAFTLWCPVIDIIGGYFTLFLTPLFMFSDTFFPLQERLSGFWLYFAEITPLLHSVRLNRMFTSGDFSVLIWWDLAYLIGGGMFFHWLSVKFFQRRIHKPGR